jgi:hypothetical protein
MSKSFAFCPLGSVLSVEILGLNSKLSLLFPFVDVGIFDTGIPFLKPRISMFRVRIFVFE